MFKRLSILFIILISPILFAKESKKEIMERFYSYDHPTCKIKIVPLVKEDQYLKDVLNELLKERNFIYTYIESNKELDKRDLYLSVKRESFAHKAYKDCEVSTVVNEAKFDRRTSKEDKKLFSKKAKRSYPRITFEGKERCRRALRDTFLEIPFCKKVKN